MGSLGEETLDLQILNSTKQHYNVLQEVPSTEMHTPTS